MYLVLRVFMRVGPSVLWFYVFRYDNLYHMKKSQSFDGTLRRNERFEKISDRKIEFNEIIDENHFD